jgi:hypothetical protein
MRKITSSVAGILAAAVLVSSIGVGSAEARSRHHYSRGNAAVAGAVIGLFGTIATLAARDAYRDRYYGGGPYYGGPYAYSYGPRYYGYRHHYRHRHHRW